MRILHVSPYYEHAWAYGGIPRAAAATVQGLAARGHEVTVCTTDACRADARLPADISTRNTASDVRVRVFPNVSNAAAYHLQLFLPLGMDAFLKAHAGDFDIAHLHGCRHIPGVLAARHLRRAGVPYVVTTHGTAPYIERRQLAKRAFDATIGRGVLERAARVIAVSEAERRQLTEFGVSPAAITVVPNPVDTHEFRLFPGAFRARLGIGRDVPLVLFLGKFTPRKRLDVLVSAVASLGRPDVRLVIAGNDMGYGRELRRRIAELGLGDRVFLPGLLSGAERLCALADADVVAYPAESEVFGLVAVEALLCGTPVIVADDSGCGEVVRTTGGGLLVPPGNVGALSEAIAAVLDDPAAWRTSALDARMRAHCFSADRVCAQIEDVYVELAARTDTRSAAAV